jgi:hypothetical protein
MLMEFLEKAVTIGCDAIEIEHKDHKDGSWRSGIAWVTASAVWILARPNPYLRDGCSEKEETRNSWWSQLSTGLLAIRELRRMGQ